MLLTICLVLVLIRSVVLICVQCAQVFKARKKIEFVTLGFSLLCDCVIIAGCMSYMRGEF